MSNITKFNILKVNLLEVELLIARIRKWFVWIGFLIGAFYIEFNSISNIQGITAAFALYYVYAMEKYLRTGNQYIKYVSATIDLVLIWTFLYVFVNFSYQFLGLFFVNAIFLAMRYGLDSWPWLTVNTALFTYSIDYGGFLEDFWLEVLWLILVSALAAWLAHQHKQMDKRLVVLNGLSHQFNSTLHSNEVLDITIIELKKVWPECNFYVAMLDEGDTFSVLASSNSENLGKIVLGSNTFHQLIQDKKAVSIKNTLDNKHLSNTTLKKFYLKSLLLVPIVIQDKTIGVIIMESNKIREFNHDETAILILASSQIGISLENARLYERMANLARIDELTNIYNRRAFHEKAEEAFEKAKANCRTFSIIMMDIDFFKQINDCLGHLKGDCILAKTAFLIRQNTRAQDILARYGGEEFIIALPETDTKEAYEVAERIRKKIEQSFFLEGLKVTISGGVASCPKDGASLVELIKKSDATLYQAKSQGRNKILVA